MKIPVQAPPQGHTCLRKRLTALTLTVGLALTVSNVQAVDIDTGNSNWRIRFDNTIKLSAIYRLQDANHELVDSFVARNPSPPGIWPNAQNFNAGDDNFRNSGFASERIDLLSEFDLSYKRRYGLRFSGAAWYDDVYNSSTDATDVANGQTPINEFPDKTRRIAGKDAEVLDAFLFGSWDLAGKRLNLRFGRHALQYGESLFYGDNGIARAQGPTDINKLLASPNAQFKEIIRPVEQISGQLQITPSLSLGGYYQFRWEEDRLPPSGSFFSVSNIPWGSNQPQFINIGGAPFNPLAGSYTLTPGAERDPSSSGQFGLQLKWHVAQTDFGLYLARYHDKGGVLYGALNTATNTTGNWYYVFPEAIKTIGISASRTIGNVNYAAEVSVRKDMPLRNANIFYDGATTAPEFATGTTAHVNFSWLASFGPGMLSKESTFLGEIAWNRYLSKDDPAQELDTAVTHSAAALQLIYSHSYRQVLPGLDLSVPLGLRYSLRGFSPVTVWDAEGNGSFNIGVEGNYLSVWQFGLTYRHYVGDAVPFVDLSSLPASPPAYGEGNPLDDRDHISFFIRRTF